MEIGRWGMSDLCAYKNVNKMWTGFFFSAMHTNSERLKDATRAGTKREWEKTTRWHMEKESEKKPDSTHTQTDTEQLLHTMSRSSISSCHSLARPTQNPEKKTHHKCKEMREKITHTQTHERRVSSNTPELKPSNECAYTQHADTNSENAFRLNRFGITIRVERLYLYRWLYKP